MAPRAGCLPVPHGVYAMGGKSQRFHLGVSCTAHASAVQLKCKEDRLAQEKSMPVSDSPWRGHATEGWVPRNGNEDARIPLLSHHTCPALSPAHWGPPPSVSSPCVLSLICCPSHFLLSISLHSNYLSKDLDLFFILFLTCSLTHQSSATLYLSVPYCLLPCVPGKARVAGKSSLTPSPLLPPSPHLPFYLSRCYPGQAIVHSQEFPQSANNVTTRMKKELSWLLPNDGKNMGWERNGKNLALGSAAPSLQYPWETPLGLAKARSPHMSNKDHKNTPQDCCRQEIKF